MDFARVSLFEHMSWTILEQLPYEEDSSIHYDNFSSGLEILSFFFGGGGVTSDSFNTDSPDKML